MTTETAVKPPSQLTRGSNIDPRRGGGEEKGNIQFCFSLASVQNALETECVPFLFQYRGHGRGLCVQGYLSHFD